MFVALKKYIRLLSGPMWIILVADAEGFVPLTFKHKEELTVRSAVRKSLFKPFCSADDASPENLQYPNAE